MASGGYSESLAFSGSEAVVFSCRSLWGVKGVAGRGQCGPVWETGHVDISHVHTSQGSWVPASFLAWDNLMLSDLSILPF